jgi:hypothetical protein
VHHHKSLLNAEWSSQFLVLMCKSREAPIDGDGCVVELWLVYQRRQGWCSRSACSLDSEFRISDPLFRIFDIVARSEHRYHWPSRLWCRWRETMGNSSSSASRHQDDTVDYGALVPQGVYTGPRDWNQAIVSQFIAQRKLAPFYRPLEDYEDAWDDDQILAARKEFPDPSVEQSDASSRIDQPSSASSFHGSSKSGNSKRPGSAKEFRPDAAIYRGAVECPICFLVRQLVHKRCDADNLRHPCSTTLAILITLDAATRLSAQNVLCKSNGQSPRPPILFRNPRHVLIVFKKTLGSCTNLLSGELELGVKDMSVLPVGPHLLD